MNQQQLLAYLERIDQELHHDTVLCVYGSAAFMLLGEEGRTSLDQVFPRRTSSRQEAMRHTPLR